MRGCIFLEILLEVILKLSSFSSISNKLTRISLGFVMLKKSLLVVDFFLSYLSSILSILTLPTTTLSISLSFFFYLALMIDFKILFWNYCFKFSFVFYFSVFFNISAAFYFSISALSISSLKISVFFLLTKSLFILFSC